MVRVFFDLVSLYVWKLERVCLCQMKEMENNTRKVHFMAVLS